MTAPPLTAAQRVERLTRIVKWVALLSIIASLLGQKSRLGDWLYPTLIGVPLAVAAIRGRDKAFMLWALYALSFNMFMAIRGLATIVRDVVYVTYPIMLDRLIGLGSVPTITLQLLAQSPGRVSVVDWAAIVVHLSYYPVPPLAAIGLALWARDRLPRYLVAISVMYLTGALIHVLVPTAPPWLAAEWGALPPVHRIIADVLGAIAPEFFRYGLGVAGGNDVAAMPSLHAAAAFLVAIAMSGGARSARLVGWGYAVAMTTSLVYLGEHYVVDALAGLALAGASWYVAPKLLRQVGDIRILPLSEPSPVTTIATNPRRAVTAPAPGSPPRRIGVPMIALVFGAVALALYALFVRFGGTFE